jgi:hypothetical protein
MVCLIYDLFLIFYLFINSLVSQLKNLYKIIYSKVKNVLTNVPINFKRLSKKRKIYK